jgi:hypothetical protein
MAEKAGNIVEIVTSMKNEHIEWTESKSRAYVDGAPIYFVLISFLCFVFKSGKNNVIADSRISLV